MAGFSSRRDFVRSTGAVVGGAVLGLGIGVVPPAVAAPDPHWRGASRDWAVALAESTMARFPNASDLGDWEYAHGLYMDGQYRVYRRTGDRRYLRYIRAWVDGIVADDGTIDYPLDSLDAVRSGTVLLVLHAETGLDKYRLAADNIRRALDGYPRTGDGAFTHDSADRRHQLWADGAFMVLPFLIGYGHRFGQAGAVDDEVSRQLLTYHRHLASDTGLLHHAYDETGRASWADPVTHRSAEFWGRAVGWYAMTCVDVLDLLPASHPDHPRVVGVLRDLVAALARYQDPATGRWFQVVDKGHLADNWTETSASTMYTYAIAKAVRRGYVSGRYQQVARRGYRGVLDRVSVGPDGLTNLADICVGTGVGDLAHYLARPRRTNDIHGLGAFLLMCEELA
ncbi:glycoside hydrolase family 88/105 protein [Goodfellowiella coeruleoviolacea]|uniref:Unsaturated rhamnogalacturonyl hydrolase n=1 Tax=Goodfellowiella coeruleoviolacea TaxID=334858 RepID=A0AAE3GL22_9PSEU|nr:glycoside hydrolase family 88 protein [Goodfellowiella coeruleoviolacea]MCP2169452.1 unsaturated rhamnogalacturonyl hydrolase [Goodfellowiella coeruleoviolacea]